MRQKSFDEKNKNQVKVSVIIPSLNRARFIKECVKSVLHSRLKEIEVICVDAGSTDGTLEILKKIEKKDWRVSVIVSQKQSYGAQVNLGFERACGEYLAIVESDDYVKSEMYFRLYEIAKQKNLDFIKANYAVFSGGKKDRKFISKKIVESDIYCDRVLWAGEEQSVFNGSIYPWAGIYKKSFVQKNKIRLNESPGASYQDNGFAFQVYAWGRRGFFLDEEFYFLRRDEQDASFYAPHKVNEIFLEFEFIYNFLVQSGFYEIFSSRFWKLKFQTYSWRANMLSQEHKLQFMERFSCEFMEARKKGILDLKFFDKNERTRLEGILQSPELFCWKKYYGPNSTWQKNAVLQPHPLLKGRESLAQKKALLVTNELSFSGAQLSALSQAKVLFAAGVFVEVWSLKEGPLREEYEKEGFKVKVVASNEFESVSVLEQIANFDIAVVNTILAVSAAAACQRLIPTIFYFRSDGELIAHFLKRDITFQSDFAKFLAIKQARYAVAVSPSLGQWLCENLNANAFVINNFLEDQFEEICKASKNKASLENSNFALESKSKKERKIKFLALGSIEERKGFDVFIQAYKMLPHIKKKNCEIHFAGRLLKGSEKFYEQITRLAKKTAGVFFHGEILERELVYRLILECDVVVVPSRNESFSRVAIEAMMMKKPVIVTDGVGAKFLVTKEAGWVCEKANAKSLCQAFSFAIENKKNLRKMGEKAREIFLQNCTKEIYSKNFLEYAERVLFDAKKNVQEKSEKFYSFDVFDTLITRKTATPTGIFAIVQKKLQTQKEFENFCEHVKENFYSLRTNAERLARLANAPSNFERLDSKAVPKEDITFEQIYDAFVFSGLLSQEQALRVMELEIQTEEENVVPIPQNIEAVKKLLSQKERVVLASDMYHSEKTIRRLLLKADEIFKDIPIYVSSEEKVCKSSGNLFRKIFEKENAKFEFWEHTGDSRKGDFEVPKSFGIAARYYQDANPLPLERAALGEFFFDEDVQKFCGLAKSARVLNRLQENAGLGASFGLFFLIPYVEFILSECVFRKIERLYFVARDGHILKQIADILIKERSLKIQTKYIYASRKAWRVFSEDPAKIDIMNWVSVSNFNFIKNTRDLAEVFGITEEEFLQFVPKNFFCEDSFSKNENQISQNESEKSDEAFAQFSQKTLYALCELLEKNADFKKFLARNDAKKRELLADYLKQEVDFSDGSYAFVELDLSGLTIFCMASVLSGLQKNCAPVKTFCYWATNLNLKSGENLFISFLPSNFSCKSIIECLCRAPHEQCEGYKKEAGGTIPVFSKTQEGRLLLKSGYGEYVFGVLSAARLYAKNPQRPKNIAAIVERSFNFITRRPCQKTLSFLGDVPFEITGRKGKISLFAPKLSKEDIFNIYFLRHIKNESVEKYFAASYFDYCLLRCESEDKALMSHYTRLVSEYKKKRMLSKLSESDLREIRREAESAIFSEQKTLSSAAAQKKLAIVYNSYSWRLGHKQVLFLKKIRQSFFAKNLLKIGFVKKAAKKIAKAFLRE